MCNNLRRGVGGGVIAQAGQAGHAVFVGVVTVVGASVVGQAAERIDSCMMKIKTK